MKEKPHKVWKSSYKVWPKKLSEMREMLRVIRNVSQRFCDELEKLTDSQLAEVVHNARTKTTVLSEIDREISLTEDVLAPNHPAQEQFTRLNRVVSVEYDSRFVQLGGK